MNFAIHLDDPLQLLEVYAVEPTVCQTGEWCCLHYGRVMLKDLDFQSQQQILCFPWEMHLAWREGAITIDGKHCWLVARLFWSRGTSTSTSDRHAGSASDSPDLGTTARARTIC